MPSLMMFVLFALLVLDMSNVLAQEANRLHRQTPSFDEVIGSRTKKHMLEVDTIPPDFPTFQIRVHDNPAPGKIFMSPLRGTPRYTYLTILDENITPLFYLRRPQSLSDFKLHANGLMTFFDGRAQCIYLMNSAYAIIDSFRAASPYVIDGHDFQMLTNGHVLMLLTDTRTVDMSVIVPGGNPAARVIGLVIHELDENKQVVFSWSSWDHFAITDATHENLTAATIDYVHANAVEADTDGNILLSSRHMDEITKINRTSGEIMWRLGGINNQFTFINDSIRFSYQHDIRRLPNGNITLFDNGNFHSPRFSRAVEYRLNERQRTAELVWEYRNTPSIYAFATGNVQRLPNGNTLISWGTTNTITEVRPDGTKALELQLSSLFTVYRTFRFPWATTEVDVTTQQPTPPALLPAYPNPFNSSTQIRYQIPEVDRVTLKVFDLLGREVATLVDEVQVAGSKTVRFDATGLATGVYFYRLQTADFAATRRFILIR